MKIGYFSPLTPIKSGISDYSEKELLPYLSKYADIDLIIDKGYTPTNPQIKKYKIFRYDKAPLDKYDVLLYHLGNNPFHIYMYNMLLKYPGIVVLHDVFLHGLIWNMTIAKGDEDKYIEAFGYCYGEEGKRIAKNSISCGLYPEFKYPLLKRIVDNSLGVIVHSRYAKKIVLDECPRADVKKIHSPCINYPQNFPDTKIRKKVGVKEDTVIISSFGYIFPHKRLDKVIMAFSHLRDKYKNVILLIIGKKLSGYNEIDSLIKELKVKDSVIETGFVPFEDIPKYLMISDICINLRFPTAGETSASCLRQMAAGKPVIVSNVGWFAELPESCCAKVDVDDYEGDLLLEYLEALAVNEKLRSKMGSNARRYVLKYHNPKKTAYNYYDVINEILFNQKTSNIIKEVAYRMADIGIVEKDDIVLREVSTCLTDLKLV